MMAGSRKQTKGKTREKSEKKRSTRKYGQAPLKHSHMGTHSCLYALGSVILILSALGLAFWKHGEAAGYVGGFGAVAVVFSVLGVRAGVKGLREREKKYISCRLGIAANILLLLSLAVIFTGGLRT